VREPRLAYRDAATGAWRSEGRRLLAIARGVGAGRQPLKLLAYQLGTTEQHVGRLLRGVERPGVDVIARAWLELGIAGHLWGLAPFDEAIGAKGSKEDSTDLHAVSRLALVR
jgi:hypothetical protein